MKHNLIAPLRSIPPIRRTLSAISIVLSLVFALAAFGVSVNTSWTYQGQLRRMGSAYAGTCNFQFTLWDAVSAGTQVGITQSINSVNVANGLFTVVLDFGDQFAGDARWLGTSVQCSGDGGFTQLDPRQPITAAPYALSLRPGARINDNTAGSNALTVSNLSPSGVGLGAFGRIGVSGGSASDSGSGVSGSATGLNARGVAGDSSGQNGSGVSGFASGVTGDGVLGNAVGLGGSGVHGIANSANATAVFGQNFSTGFAGRFIGPVDISGPLTVISGSGDGIKGTGLNGVHGVSLGNSFSLGVLGEASGTGSAGVSGSASGTNSAGVFGSNSSSNAIWGLSIGSGSAIYGENTSTGFAGRFVGPVDVQGTLTKSAGSFKIDHPMDPANKFLSHSFVESPEMMNIYNGNVTTDASGNATVTLPDYFEALNRDYRYQLTVVGQFAQAIVSRKIAGNTFEIRTDKPGVEVSWLVMGNRQDAYAKEHPIVVEEFKPAEEQGKYLYPAGFGADEEKRIGHLQGPAPRPDVQDPSGAGPSSQASK